jgi:Flp pilus assembly protein TadD
MQYWRPAGAANSSGRFYPTLCRAASIVILLRAALKGNSDRMTLKIYRLGFSAAVLLAAAIPMAVQAQYSGVDQSASVEAQASAELRGAIKRLASNPADSDALIDAGNAALLLGDANAALNFFTRADALRPSDGRIKLGLATASVRSENPFEALRLFDEAVRLGMPERSLAADRALAFDLLGNFDRAQMDYKLARSASSSNDLIVKQAISLSLGGKYNDADKLLLPLLQQNDGDAWRARAFLLAARGDYNESVKVARGFMNARSAEKIEIYLRQMPKLTGAQQAAAIHLGHFPASDIGRDSAAIQSIAGNYPAAKASGSGRLIPSGDPLGPKGSAENAGDNSKLSRKERAQAAKQAALIVKRPVAVLPEMAARSVQSLPSSLPQTPAPPMPIDVARSRIIMAEKASANMVAIALPIPIPAALPPAVALPVAAALTAPVQVVPVQTVPVQTVPVQAGPAPTAPIQLISTVAALPQPVEPPKPEATPVPVAAPAPVIAAPIMQQPTPPQQDSVPAIANLNDKTVVMQSSPAPMPAAPAADIVQPRPAAVKAISTFDLGEVVGAIEIPESEKKLDVVPVDLKKLAAVRPKPVVKEAPKAEKATKKAEPAKPEYPARYWVQVATGNSSSFPADMRNFRRKSSDLFKGQSAWTSPWGKSSRLVVGPFENLNAAKKWEAAFRKGGGGGFVWQSGDGTQVTPLK